MRVKTVAEAAKDEEEAVTICSDRHLAKMSLTFNIWTAAPIEIIILGQWVMLRVDDVVPH